jgi:hypothetical protein
MTDAALPVTQGVVESFAESYLTSVGCSIEKRDRVWAVDVPEEAETTVLEGDSEVAIGRGDTDEVAGLDGNLAPESALFQSLLEEASQRTTIGAIEIAASTDEISPPDWIVDGPVELSSADFTPYYDRLAVVFLFEISIETVSEFEQEVLHAIALDARTQDELDELEENFLQLTTVDEPILETTPASRVDATEANQLIDLGREAVEDRAQSRLKEVRRDASRAAEAELEDFRQMQQQRLQELESRLNTLDEKIEKLQRSAEETNSEEQRVEDLRKRKELRNERNEVTSQLQDIRDRRDRGFPDKQAAIRDRHSLEVTIAPLTMTEVEYERGEATFVLEQDGVNRSITIGYGSGVGVTEEIHCESCDRMLTEANQLRTITDGIKCEKCTVSNL